MLIRVLKVALFAEVTTVGAQVLPSLPPLFGGRSCRGYRARALHRCQARASARGRTIAGVRARRGRAPPSLFIEAERSNRMPTLVGGTGRLVLGIRERRGGRGRSWSSARQSRSWLVRGGPTRGVGLRHRGLQRQGRRRVLRDHRGAPDVAGLRHPLVAAGAAVTGDERRVQVPARGRHAAHPEPACRSAPEG